MDARGERTLPVKAESPIEYGSLDPRNIEEYQLGDDINLYIGRRKVAVPSFPAERERLFEEVSDAVDKSYTALLETIDEYRTELVARSEVVLQLGRLKSESIFVQKMRSVTNQWGANSSDVSMSSTPTASVAPGDMRKNRLSGVDVSSLPAGFGKRKTASAGGTGAKKVKEITSAAQSPEPGST